MRIYFLGQVCLNGHQITGHNNKSPAPIGEPCPICGENTISICPKCLKEIAGYYDYNEMIEIYDSRIPKKCSSCGEPFPWTLRFKKHLQLIFDPKEQRIKDKIHKKQSALDIINEGGFMTGKEGDVGVFISYIHENKEVVHRLCEDLRKSGIEVWLDEDKIKPGQYWKDVIRDAIQRGSFFIACFSQEYNKRIKSHMNEELTLAIDELRKRPNDQAWFIPVLLSGEIPNRSISDGVTLRDIQWVDLRQDWDNGIRKILNAVAPKDDEKKMLFKMLDLFHPNIKKRIINLEEEIEVQIFDRYLDEFKKIAEYLTQNRLFEIKRPEERVYGIGPDGPWKGFILNPLKGFKDIINDPNFEKFRSD